MTKVYLEKDGLNYTVCCKDHAGTEAACAAVSMLCYTLAGYLHNISDMCDIKDERLEPGDVRICFRSKDQCDTVVSAVFDMVCVGFMQLAASYPDEASVTLQEAS